MRDPQDRTSVYLNAEDRAVVERIRAKMIGGDKLSLSWIIRQSLAVMAEKLDRP